MVRKTDANRGHVRDVRKHGHEHDHPSASQRLRQRLDQTGDLHWQLVEVEHADQQAQHPDQLAEYGQQQNGLPLARPVAPRPDEYDEHARHRVLYDRLPHGHVGHQLLDPGLLVVVGVVGPDPFLQRRARRVAHVQINPARFLQVQVLRGQVAQHAGHDEERQQRFDRHVVRHVPHPGYEVQPLPFFVLLVHRFVGHVSHQPRIVRGRPARARHRVRRLCRYGGHWSRQRGGARVQYLKTVCNNTPLSYGQHNQVRIIANSL